MPCARGWLWTPSSECRVISRAICSPVWQRKPWGSAECDSPSLPAGGECFESPSGAAAWRHTVQTLGFSSLPSIPQDLSFYPLSPHAHQRAVGVRDQESSRIKTLLCPRSPAAGLGRPGVFLADKETSESKEPGRGSHYTGCLSMGELCPRKEGAGGEEAFLGALRCAGPV